MLFDAGDEWSARLSLLEDYISSSKNGTSS